MSRKPPLVPRRTRMAVYAIPLATSIGSLIMFCGHFFVEQSAYWLAWSALLFTHAMYQKSLAEKLMLKLAGAAFVRRFAERLQESGHEETNT